MKLKDLHSKIAYDPQWGVWAEKINGEFNLESNCRFGQLMFENGGRLDGMEFLATNERIVDAISGWADGNEELEGEGLTQFIDEMNEYYSR